MKIGVCGTGRMGSSIAQRLMSVGHEVGVWNRHAAKTKPLVEAGARLFASPAELAEGCEVIVVMLLNDAASEAVYRGPNGILKSTLASKLIVDMSTVRPDTMISLGGSVASQGAAFVECPVAGQHRSGQRGQAVRSLSEVRRPMWHGQCRYSSNCAAASSMSAGSARARP